MVEGARLESVCTGNCTEGSNPSLSANLYLTALRSGFFLLLYIMYECMYNNKINILIF